MDPKYGHCDVILGNVDICGFYCTTFESLSLWICGRRWRRFLKLIW